MGDESQGSDSSPGSSNGDMKAETNARGDEAVPREKSPQKIPTKKDKDEKRKESQKKRKATDDKDDEDEKTESTKNNGKWGGGRGQGDKETQERGVRGSEEVESTER